MCIIYLLSGFVPQMKLLIELTTSSKYNSVRQYNSFLLFLLCLSTNKQFKTFGIHLPLNTTVYSSFLIWKGLHCSCSIMWRHSIPWKNMCARGEGMGTCSCLVWKTKKSEDYNQWILLESLFFAIALFFLKYCSKIA